MEKPLEAMTKEELIVALTESLELIKDLRRLVGFDQELRHLFADVARRLTSPYILPS